MQSVLRLVLRNTLLIVAVFLPTFLIALAVEARLRGSPASWTPVDHAVGSFLFLYVTLFPITLLTGFFYQALLFLVPTRWTPEMRRAATIVLAATIPGSAAALEHLDLRLLSGGGVFIVGPGASAIACLVLGVLARLPAPPRGAPRPAAYRS